MYSEFNKFVNVEKPGYFVNEDFGMTVNRIEDGILGKIGPLKFKEKL